MRSLIPGDDKHQCHYCGYFFEHTHKHHIFGGANRKWSERYGLYVHLCPAHHNMSDQSVHFNKEMMNYYHRIGQMCFETWYREQGHDAHTARYEFMKIFARNYLEEPQPEKTSEQVGFHFLEDTDDLEGRDDVHGGSDNPFV